MIEKIINFLPTAYYVVVKAHWLYQVACLLTFLCLIFLFSYGYKMHKESLRHYDFFIDKIHIFVEERFNERTLFFNLKNLSETPVVIDRVQVVIYDTGNKSKPLTAPIKLGIVNPFKKEDTASFNFILDNPKGMGFNFTEVIKKNDYALSVYKVIIMVYYEKINMQAEKEQRFEYLYKVSKLDGSIKGIIDNVPKLAASSKQMAKDIPFEVV